MLAPTFCVFACRTVVGSTVTTVAWPKPSTAVLKIAATHNTKKMTYLDHMYLVDKCIGSSPVWGEQEKIKKPPCYSWLLLLAQAVVTCTRAGLYQMKKA